MGFKAAAYWSGLAGTALYVTACVLSGLQVPHYSHVSQYLSEAVALGMPYGPLIRYGLLVPSGVLISAFYVLAASAVPRSVLGSLGLYGLAIFHGGLHILASIFPCVEGCNIGRSTRILAQDIHNFIALFSYLLVPFCLSAIGFGARRWPNGFVLSVAATLAAIVCFVFDAILWLRPFSPYAGLFQRIMEASVLIWIVTFITYLRWQTVDNPVHSIGERMRTGTRSS
jgi:hypothetical protein